MIPLDTPLRGLPLAVVDCETTGLPGPDAHVVEVAVVHATFGADEARVAFSSRVCPPVAIPESASRVHGITDADVAGAPTWSQVAARVAEAYAGRLLVAYNAPADYAFLKAEADRLGDAPPPWPWLDLLVVRKATKRRGAPGKLVEVAEEYGIVLDAHGATGDALTTALLVRPLMRRAAVEVLPPVRTLGELFAWQREAALYQERDFHAYAMRSRWTKPPSCGWHELEGVALPEWDRGPSSVPCPDCGGATVLRVGKLGSPERVTLAGEPHLCEARA